MTDTTVQLGGFRFGRFEVPEAIGFGGEQTLTVHRLVGGRRVVDAMGEDPASLDWSGVFVGANALDRALYLDGLRKAGKPLALTWSELSYTVVIRAFRCDFVRFYRLPYRITVEVVADLTSPVTAIASPSPEQLVGDDLATANGLAGRIGDGTLSGLMGGLTQAIAKVGSIATATQGELDTALTPLAAVRSQVGILMQSTDATLANVASAGGLAPTNPLARQVAALTGQITATTDMPLLLNLDRTLGRMQTNIGSLGAGTRSTVQAGGNLFAVASAEYGNTDGWAAIAAANGLTDPQLAGVTALTIPPFADTGGILGG